MLFAITTISALVGVVSANSYSIGCMTTLMNIAGNPQVQACLTPNLLLPVLVGLGNGPQSVVDPINSWVTSMCALPACSSDTLSGIVNNVTAGCQDEFGLPGVQQTLNFVKTNYLTTRKVMCLAEGGVNCVTQTLKNIQSVAGTLDLDDNNVAALTKSIQNGFPASVICTDCMKGAYTIINQDLPGTFSANATNYATATCGASFANGGIPPGLIETASQPTTSSAPAPTTTATATATTWSSSVVPTTTPTILPAPTQTKAKSSAVGGPVSLLSSGSFTGVAISGLIVIWTGMAFA
jgi:hypothetical protein